MTADRNLLGGHRCLLLGFNTSTLYEVSAKGKHRLSRISKMAWEYPQQIPKIGGLISPTTHLEFPHLRGIRQVCVGWMLAP